MEFTPKSLISTESGIQQDDPMSCLHFVLMDLDRAISTIDAEYECLDLLYQSHLIL